MSRAMIMLVVSVVPTFLSALIQVQEFFSREEALGIESHKYNDTVIQNKDPCFVYTTCLLRRKRLTVLDRSKCDFSIRKVCTISPNAIISSERQQ